jgi:hypothetical protein
MKNEAVVRRRPTHHKGRTQLGQILSKVNPYPTGPTAADVVKLLPAALAGRTTVENRRRK